MAQIHIDTDIGGDMDDVCAICMALASPAITLVGVTTEQEFGGVRAGMVHRLLALAGRSDVPVAAGAEVDAMRYRVRPGLPDEAANWDAPITPAPGPLDAALDLLAASIERGATIVAIGSCANLALLERRSPGILAGADIVLMGGLLDPVRPGFPPWDYTFDWNFQQDVESAQLVLRAADPLLVPLAVTVETALRRRDLPALRAAPPFGPLIARQAAVHDAEYHNDALAKTCGSVPDDLINFLHDPLAVAIAAGWRDGVAIERTPIAAEVHDGWLRLRRDPSGKPTRIVTAVDGPRFDAHWRAMMKPGF
jgi:inosine-uridine nucleoside N-ribohydrolase